MKTFYLFLIYIAYLLGLTRIFQLTEREAEEKLCRESREKVVKYKRELAISSFYEFGYNKRLCKVLEKRLQSGKKFSLAFLKEGFTALVKQNCTEDAINQLNMEARKRKLNRQWGKEWSKALRPTNLSLFRDEEFNLSGTYIKNLLTDVVMLSFESYPNMIYNCFEGEKWSFDQTFVYVGSVATTIGFGNVTPKTQRGKILTMFVAGISIPLFGILCSKINKQVDKGIIKLQKWIKKRSSNYAKKDFIERVFHKRTIMLLYFTSGICLFVVLPSFLFRYMEGWTYLDSAYFSIITITKIGFGDYIPRMVPPDFAADYIFNQQWCLRALTNPSPQSGPTNQETGMPIACNMTTWPPHVEKIFTLYRVLIFFWMIFGISFSMTIVTLVNRRVEKYLQKHFPGAFIAEQKETSLLRVFQQHSVPKIWDSNTGTRQPLKEKTKEVKYVKNNLDLS